MSALLQAMDGPSHAIASIATERARTRELTLQVVDANPSFNEEFRQYLHENFHVWERFREEADKIRATGRRRYSARTIGEVLRHQSALREVGSQWKLNDHAWPNMSRLYMLLNPAAAAEEFFETRGR
jgi:hypothetical protein